MQKRKKCYMLFVIDIEENDIWSYTCSTYKYLKDLYKASKKRKRKIETNLVDNSVPIDITHLSVYDFFKDRELFWPID